MAEQIVLASRPQGEPVAANFRLEEVEMPRATPGAVVVENRWMSVDPYMRGRMNDVKSYVPPFQIDAPLDGGAVGVVVESQDAALPEGSWVSHGLGWRTHALVPVDQAQPVDPQAAPASAYLCVLGMPGLTAWAGLTQAAELRPGDVVFVSAAAGAVGSLVGQLAKELGAAKVIGSAGSPEKVARLRELGFDAAFSYKDGPVGQQLAGAAPEGIDVYFDNVGADHLEAAIDAMRSGGRIALCGAISQYNAVGEPYGIRNLTSAIGKNLTLRGFIVSRYAHLRDEFAAQVAPMVGAGRLRYDETVREGLQAAPQAFIDLLAGANTGKMLVRL